jgi:hypothetical protein
MDPIGASVLAHFLDKMEEDLPSAEYKILVSTLLGDEMEDRTQQILKKNKKFRKWILRKCMQKLLI